MSQQIQADTRLRDAAAQPAAQSPPFARQTVVPERDHAGMRRRSSGAWFTIPAMCAGICLIACALIVGQVEENRQLAWQRAKLQTDLDHLQKQIATNADFVSRLSTDANLVERLAQRQMKMVREGAAVLELEGQETPAHSSPYRLVTIPPPPAVAPYEPAPGVMTHLFTHPQIRLYAYGIGAFLVAAGLILGASGSSEMR